MFGTGTANTVQVKLIVAFSSSRTLEGGFTMTGGTVQKMETHSDTHTHMHAHRGAITLLGHNLDPDIMNDSYTISMRLLTCPAGNPLMFL